MENNITKLPVTIRGDLLTVRSSNLIGRGLTALENVRLANAYYNNAKEMAGDFDEFDLHKENSKQCAEVEKWLQTAADLGHVESQYQLGHFIMARSEKWMDATHVLAMSYFKKAATQHCVEASYWYGNFLLHQSETTNQELSFIKWIEYAAQNDSADAQELLGDLYLRGEGVNESIDTAKFWFEKAIQQTNGAVGQHGLAICLEREGRIDEAINQLFLEALKSPFLVSRKMVRHILKGNTLALRMQKQAFTMKHEESTKVLVGGALNKKKIRAKKSHETINRINADWIGNSVINEQNALAADLLIHLTSLSYPFGNYWRGRMHEEGVYAEKSINDAIWWYKKSLNSGEYCESKNDEDALLRISALEAKLERITNNSPSFSQS